MFRLIAVGAMMCCMSLAPAAAARCVAPYAPQIPNGRTATADEMAAARRDTTAFVAASDIYQTCIVENQLDYTRVDSNQRDKARTVSAFNAAIAAYNAAHPEVRLSSR